MIRVITTRTWAARLVPNFSGIEQDYFPIDEFDFGLQAVGEWSACVVSVLPDNAGTIAAWWQASRVPNRCLVVVGESSLRYQWEWRELGASDVVGHVWEADRVIRICRRFAARQPVAKERWPGEITARLKRSFKKTLDQS